ncbi:MFS transporter ['Paenibacillus yunnanensis' Narsing Rao et al. 2020]|uniref:MFS transporter n=1 Tax=Paenibacillus tengchongensis TaxID=2608684 RepID=UPI00124C8F26|nr:MFS transporter [Paenibacillus tengchongensis]
MQKRNYYGLLATVSFSTLGDTAGLFTMEWLASELTDSKLALGGIALVSGITELLLRLLGSPLSDRLNRVRLMAILTTLRILAIVVPLFMGLTGSLQLWHLFVAAILSGAGAALFMPTAMAIIPGIAADSKLTRAFAAVDACRSSAVLLGPALAGVLITASGTLPTLGINAVCYAAAVCSLLILRRIPMPVPTSSPFSFMGYQREIAAGFSFYRQLPAMLMIMGMAAVSNLSSAAVWTMMGPYVRQILHGDATVLGMLTTSLALGTFSGLGLISVIGEIKRRRAVMLGSLACIGLATVIWGLFPVYPVALAAVFVTGACGPFFGSLSSALHSRLVPAELQGRVNAIRLLIGGGLAPIGAFAGSAVAQLSGVPAMFVLAGLLPVLCAGVMAFLPGLKALDGDIAALSARMNGTRTSPSLLQDTAGQVPVH